MIQSESITFGGKQFIRTWSDNSLMLERDGILYEEAIDPIDSGRTYTESHQTIISPDAEFLPSDSPTML